MAPTRLTLSTAFCSVIGMSDWVPLAKALFEVERNPAIKDQAWFDFQGKAQRLVAIMGRSGSRCGCKKPECKRCQWDGI